ncbi:hypothetical protein ACFQWG_01565 [Schaalia naturae]|uniref:Uncharacterized protein n=1 Tax=Schaalia naturae TaxID=635203 RepID=A0ABW2SIG5_9ACTO
MGSKGAGRRSVCARRRATSASVHLGRFQDVDVSREITEVARVAVEQTGLRGIAALQAEASLIGASRAQLRSFARGMLPEGRTGAFEPAASQPDMWELRVQDARLGAFRFYHGEPECGDPDVAVMLFHQKSTDGLSADEIAQAQDRAMAQAQRRYERGRPCRWGHVDHCSSCLNQ